MSKAADQAGGGPADAGRFWAQYGAARAAGRDRAQAREPGAADSGPGAAPNGGRPGQTGPHHELHEHECLDWCPICRGAEVLRSGAPPELRGQLQAVQRDSLMMLRSLIDSYLDRSPHPPNSPGGHDDGVEDIPIG